MQEKNDLPNLYNILGITIDVCEQENCDELIKKAYIKRAKSCHPDKHPERPEAAECFQLITMAYDILKNENDRNIYNYKLKLNQQSNHDFNKLKSRKKEFNDSIGEYKQPTGDQELSFREHMKQMDIKNKYDDSALEPISMQDTSKMMNNMSQIRAREEIDTMPEKLFDVDIDLKKFNAVFDKIHHKKKNQIVQHYGVPSAWNDVGTITNFSCFDRTDQFYDKLYAEDDKNDTSKQLYAGIDFDEDIPKITREDLKNIRDADYVDQHNVLDDDYYKEMKNELLKRDIYNEKFDCMSFGDFRTDTDGYGFLDQIGLDTNDKFAIDFLDDDLSKKLDKLTMKHLDDNISRKLDELMTDNNYFTNYKTKNDIVQTSR